VLLARLRLLGGPRLGLLTALRRARGGACRGL
jgi:hypothetical protein